MPQVNHHRRYSVRARADGTIDADTAGSFTLLVVVCALVYLQSTALLSSMVP